MYKYTDASTTVVTDGQGWSGLVTDHLVKEWISSGNTPAPADAPDLKQEAISKINGLESQTLLPRVTREFILGAFKAEAQKTGLDPMLLPAYVKLKALDDQIAALRAQL